MPRIRKLTVKEDRERKLQLTRIRSLRRYDEVRAAELWTEYRQNYFIIPTGPRKPKADEAEASIKKKNPRGSNL